MGRLVNRSPKKHRRAKPLTYQTVNLRGRGFNRQVQWVIYNVRRYFEQGKDANCNLLPFAQALKRTCKALGVSRQSVIKVTQRVESGRPFETPGKVHPNRQYPKRDVDDFTKDAIKSLIYDMHHKGELLTLATLLLKIRERGIEFTGKTNTLWKLLQDLGFSHQRRDSKRYLMELPRIVVQRVGYLRNFLYHVLVKKTNIVYIDETWIHRFGTGKRRDWQDSDTRSVPRGARIASLGARYILVHAGSKEGFVEGAGLIYRCNTKPKPGDDYHGDMNTTMFTKWFLNQLLPNLHQPSGIVADNAPYHSTQVKWKDIFDAMTVEQVKEWLSKEDVPHTASMSLKRLRELCLIKAKEFGPTYQLEDLLKNTPHVILRLPPYHPILNAIEFIWSSLKRHMDVDARNGKPMEENFQAAVASISPQEWSNDHDKVVKTALELYRRDTGRDFDVNECEERVQAEHCNPCVIALGEDDSSSDEWLTASDSDQVGTSSPVSASVSAPDGVVPLPQHPRGSRSDQRSFTSPCDVEILEGRSDNERTGVLALLSLSDECSASVDQHGNPEVISVHDDGEIISGVPLSERESMTWEDLDNRRDDEIIVIKYHETIDVASLRRLKPRQWLNGKVINFHLALTIDEFSRRWEGRKAVFALDSLFFGDYQSRGFRHVQHKTMEINVFGLDILFIPIHLGNHWTLCAVNVQERTLTYYDSMGGKNEDALQVVLKWLKEEHQAKKRERLRGAWKMEHAKPVAQQDNVYDCGVFVLCYCRLLCQGRSCNFKMDPAVVRATLLKEILTCELLKLPLDTVSVAMEAAKLPKTKVSSTNRPPVSKKARVIAGGAWVLHSASISQSNKIFGVRSNYQCTAIATYFAGVLCSQLQVPGAVDVNFSPEDLDAIVIYGDEYYRECRAWAKTENPYLAVDELEPKIHTPNGVLHLEWSLAAQGQFLQVHTELLPRVREQMEPAAGRHEGFLFMGHLKTVCFVPQTERKSWFFNSHSVNESNKFSQRGKARLFSCHNVEALISLLLTEHPHDNQWWQLYKIAFEKETPVEHNEGV